MPVMSTIERAFCRNASWRTLTRRVVIPWALDGVTLDGEVLELGSGAGVLAEEHPVDKAATTAVITAFVLTPMQEQ